MVVCTMKMREKYTEFLSERSTALLHVKKGNITILLYAGIPITIDIYEHTIIVT
ncbi:MAG: hypothetical protein PHU26_02705 [Methanofollis liminatans]|nr:hypothetical protein [Methanofollis liminatans]